MSSVQEFRETALRECERASRYDIRLSMSIYEVGSTDENNLLVRRLVRILNRRVRSIDHVGWFDSGQIGVLLPHTPSDGAFKLAQDIFDLIASVPSLPPFTIYTYPSEKWPITQKNYPAFFSRMMQAFKNMFSGHSIHSREEFRAYLELEQERATRYGHIFSMLVFNSEHAVDNGTSMNRVVKAMNSRLRGTDELGFYDENNIAAILPYATASNTDIIGAEICKIIGIAQQGAYTVHTYPTNWVTKVKQTEASSPAEEDAPTDSANLIERRKSAAQIRQTIKASQTGSHYRTVDDFIARPVPYWKRGVDLVGSCCGLILFAPIFALAALGVKLTSPGPVFFRQERIGYKQKPFVLLKFRTMSTDSNSESHRKFMKKLIVEVDDQPNTKMSDDARIFAFGRFLRRTSIDELPQLVNVLKGEMSLVGPRPCLDYEAEEFLRWHTRRFYIMPGMTGLWQVSGKNRLSFKQMIRLDIQYSKKITFWLDVKILVKTIWAVIFIFLDEKS